MRGVALGLAAVVTAAALTWGCGPRPGASPSKPASVRIGLVTDAGGIDDQSFNALAWSGMQKAQKDLGVTGRFIESKELADYETNLSTMADQGNDLVFAVGILMEEALARVAPRYPNTKFAIIDGAAPNLPNCLSLRFREEEGAFLAGYLAGAMSRKGAIGFVGGMELPLIRKFEIGYFAGGRTANPAIRMIPKYVGNWTDVAKGKELAESMLRADADIVFAAAGKAGLGALDAVAARGEGYYGIGVDADQDHLHPGRMLVSMMKGVDVAVFETTKAVKEGRWQPGERVFGVKEGGVHLSPMKYTRSAVPAAVLARLDEITRKVADGTIKAPSTDEEMQNFVPPVVSGASSPEPPASGPSAGP